MNGVLVPLPLARNEELSDEALLAAGARGERAAWGALFDRRSADVHRFLSRLRGTDAQDVEDLLQSTFLEAQRAAPRFKRQASVRSWLFGIAAHLAHNQTRSRMRKTQAMAELALVPEGRTASPGEVAERRQLIERLAEALRRLDHDRRVAFLMCDVEEIPGVEAARALGVRPGTLWRRLHEARVALRSALEGP